MQATTNPLPTHQAVNACAGPEALAGITGPLTEAEEAAVDVFLTELEQTGDAELSARLARRNLRMPTGRVPEFRRIMFGQVAR